MLDANRLVGHSGKIKETIHQRIKWIISNDFNGARSRFIIMPQLHDIQGLLIEY